MPNSSAWHSSGRGGDTSKTIAALRLARLASFSRRLVRMIAVSSSRIGCPAVTTSPTWASNLSTCPSTVAVREPSFSGSGSVRPRPSTVTSTVRLRQGTPRTFTCAATLSPSFSLSSFSLSFSESLSCATSLPAVGFSCSPASAVANFSPAFLGSDFSAAGTSGCWAFAGVLPGKAVPQPANVRVARPAKRKTLKIGFGRPTAEIPERTRRRAAIARDDTLPVAPNWRSSTLPFPPLYEDAFNFQE